jgi:hypothetical protein
MQAVKIAINRFIVQLQRACQLRIKKGKLQIEEVGGDSPLPICSLQLSLCSFQLPLPGNGATR